MDGKRTIPATVFQGTSILLWFLLVGLTVGDVCADEVTPDQTGQPGSSVKPTATVKAKDETGMEENTESDLPPILLLNEAELKELEAEDAESERFLKKPSDFAPPERIIVGRDATVFRKDGTLLQTAQGSTALVDENQLLSRKLAMYGGSRFTTTLAYPDRPRRVLRAVEATTQKPRRDLMGGAWGKTAIIVLVLGLGAFYVVIRRGVLDRKSKFDQPRRKKKEPRLKVTVAPH